VIENQSIIQKTPFQKNGIDTWVRFAQGQKDKTMLYRFDFTPPDVFEFADKYYTGVDSLSSAQEEVLGAVFGDTVPEQRLLSEGLNTHDDFFKVEECDLMVGQSGGKNKIAEILISYACMRWACLSDPYAVFHLPRSDTFDVVNVSQAGKSQAKNVFFKRFKSALYLIKDPKTGLNWFETYAGMKMNQGGGRGNMQEELVTIPSPVPGTPGLVAKTFSREHTSIEGYIMWLVVMDEPSRAYTKATYTRAIEQYRVVEGKQQGSFKSGQFYRMAFSYPNESGGDYDVIVDLCTKENEGKDGHLPSNVDNPRAFVRTYYTWEFNPAREEEEYKHFFDRDEVEAKRRFMCVIPPSKYKFFSPHLSKIDDCVNPFLTPEHFRELYGNIGHVAWKSIYNQQLRTIEGKEKQTEFTALELLEILADDKPRIWALDPGKTKDTFYITSGYPVPITGERPVVDLEDYDVNGIAHPKEIPLKYKPIIDIQLYWKPDPDHPVDFLNVERVLMNLIANHFPNTIKIFSDTWNSESLMAHARDLGYEAEVLFPSNAMQLEWYTVLRSLVWNVMIEYLPGEHVREMGQLIKENKKIDHPDGGSKDAADTLAIIAYKMQEIEMANVDDHVYAGNPAYYDPEIQELLKQWRLWMRIYQKKFSHQAEDADILRKFVKTQFGAQVTKDQANYLWKLDEQERQIDAGQAPEGIGYNKNIFYGYIKAYQKKYRLMPRGPRELSEFLRNERNMQVTDEQVTEWWDMWEADSGFIRDDYTVNNTLADF